MNHVHSSVTDCSINFSALVNHASYLRLEQEDDSEEADEMERLKDRQKQREEKEQEKCSKEKDREEPVLA